MTGVPVQPAPAAVADHPLRRLRRHRGLTLAVLADLSGLSGSFLSMVENGQRALTRRDHVNAVAAALRVAPAEIEPLRAAVTSFHKRLSQKWPGNPHVVELGEAIR
jgi:transcriptional regulator with XRE-family HTH domain